MVSWDPKNGDLMVILDGKPGILWRPPSERPVRGRKPTVDALLLEPQDHLGAEIFR